MIVKKSEMKNIKTIPTGYKKTEAGIIPEDWDVFLLGKVFDFKNGLNKGKEYFGVGTPIINYMDVYIAGGIYSSFVQGKVLVTQEEKKNYSARKGDVFFTRTSETVEEIGLSSVLLDEIKDAVFSGFILRARQKTDIFVDSFMKYCFRAEQLRKQIKNTASYTTRALTNGSMLSKVFATVPNKKEQSAIAKVLSDTDRLITALEQLIIKKKAIKTATMQQLLTGRTRLPQFAKHPDGTIKGYKSGERGHIPEDWEAKPFGELFDSLPHRRTLRKEDIVSFVGMQDVSENAQLTKQTQLSFSEVRGGFTYFERGDVLVAKITPCFENGKGCHTDSLLTDVGFGSTEFHVLRAKKSSYSKFIYYWTINTNLRDVLESEMVGSAGHRRVPLSAIQNYLIPSPQTKLEQTAIAAILSDMDDELEALEQKLAKVRDIKQGMMQQLLTGRIRLPLDHQP